jgi:acetylornithine deacetylase
MDGDWHGDTPVERPVIEYLEGLFAPYSVAMERLPVSERHESLLITVPGRRDAPALLFESHMDTVPADDWPDRAFVPHIEDGLLYGRGACDDKGSLAAMALALLDLLESGETPPTPVLFLAAGDEEYAQTGIKGFREDAPPVGRGVFGEPTKLAPIVQHRGTLRWDITVHGRSAHTARPELGVNAIYGAVAVIQEIGCIQSDLQKRFPPGLTPGPALTVTMIRGGRTRNAVPDECTLALDFRLAPGMDLDAARTEVTNRLDTLGHSLTHSPLQLQTPALATSPNDPFSRQVLFLCRRHAGPDIALEGAPYGTDASWMAHRGPMLVLGPGDIAYAHAVDERIPLAEVVTCARIYGDILHSDPSEGKAA